MTAPPEQPPVEDEATDIIGKAARGLGVSTPPHGSEDALASAARSLGLHVGRLLAVARSEYHPEVPVPDGLAMFTTPWGDMLVNAYVAFDQATRKAAVFDTGADATAMLRFLDEQSLEVDALFITHSHRDHIASLASFSIPRMFSPATEHVGGTDPIPDGSAVGVGGLRVEARLTPGHSPGGTSYAIGGLSTPVAIVGDAIFAGSIGGPKVSYSDARDSIREKIFSLADDTVLCPGHGPLTTVGFEKSHNPFFPECA